MKYQSNNQISCKIRKHTKIYKYISCIFFFYKIKLPEKILKEKSEITASILHTFTITKQIII